MQFDKQFILDSLEQNIFVKDIDSVYLFANSTYATSVGETSSSIIGKNDLDLFPKCIADKFRQGDALLIQNQQILDTVESIVINGKEKAIKIVKKPLFVNGKVTAIVGIFWELTQTIKEKEHLKKLEYGLNKAQKLAHIGHWELDLSTNNFYLSNGVYRIFGYRAQEFTATYESFLEYFHPDDRERVKNCYDKSLSEKLEAHIVHRIIRKNGEEGFVEARWEHEFDDNGTVLRSIGTIQDITKQKIIENELLLASEVFAKMSDGVVITDAAERIIKVNESFSKITGFSFKEVQGKTPNIFSSGWHDKQFYIDMWKEISKHGLWKGELTDRRKSGEVYTAEVSILALHNAEGMLTNYISITEDISKKKKQEELIHNLAYFDSLTNLPNRVLLQERVMSRLPFIKRNQKKMALMFIDMDNFKNVNDTLGHMIGDEFLIAVSKAIKGALREQDTVARLGGDEFTIIIEDIESIMEILPLAEKIISLFYQPVIIKGNKLYTSVSMGISIYPDDGETYEQLVKAADTAMYQVKETGKNNFKFYTQSMNDKIMERLSVEYNLRSAINNKEFFLVYQPKVNLESNSVYGMEALIRWNHPELGLVGPDKFIGIAEEIGMIYELGLWVVKQALLDTKSLHVDGNMLIVSINVSSKQLENENFIKDICKLVDDSGVDKHYVELEITESHIMNHIEDTLKILNELSARGFNFSIDDFGTGYSSLSYLKKLPARTIKIDKSFVLDIDKDENDRSIIAAIIAMAQALEKDVIAEGSETQEHVDALKSLGCSNVQGYFFSKPILIDKLKEFINKFGK